MIGLRTVHVQWDPERSLRGSALPCYGIQIGLSRHIIIEFVREWIFGIEDFTAGVARMSNLLKAGQAD